MKVLIVDRSELIIERLQQLLMEDKKIAVAYGAISYKDGSRLFNEINPDAVLLDSGMPCNECIELLTEIKAKNPGMLVIILSNNEDEDFRLKCISLGADFFFDKYHEFEKIPGVINRLVNVEKDLMNGYSKTIQ